MGDLNTPGVPDGTEDRLLVVPSHPADFEVVMPAKPAPRGGRDTPVHHDQLQAVGDALPSQVFQHQLTGPVLVG